MQHTDNVGANEVRRLISLESGPCISIYLPTHESGPEIQQDKIRLKNMLRQAAKELNRMGIDGARSEQVLKPAKKLLDDSEFWKYQANHLALFLSVAGYDIYRLPITLSEQLHAGSSFHLKPLFSLLAEDTTFYILAVSQNQVRFFEADRYRVSQIELSSLPDNLADVLTLYESQKQLQLRTGMPSGKGARGGLYHGHGGGGDVALHKLRVREYFQRIDAALRDFLKPNQAPLVFAGVEYLYPLYREVSSSGNLLDEIVSGNPEQLELGTLHQKAWSVVAALFDTERKRAFERYRNFLPGGDSSSDLKEILHAAVAGRVDTLFVPAGFHQWGVFRHEEGQVEFHDNRQVGDQDLFDVAAVQTFLNGGTVYVLMPEDLGVPFPLGAIYRYPLEKKRINE